MSRISAMPSGVSVAGLGRRFVAALIDALPIGAISGGSSLIVTLARPSATNMIVLSIVGVVLSLAWSLYLWWVYATRGAGPGARAMGIQVLGLTDGRPVGWGRYFLRELVWSASGVFVLPWIVLVVMMVTHQRRQGWHDLAAKAVVVRRVRALDSGGSVARSAIQSASTVGLPAHLAMSSFAGSSGQATDELPSSAGYTPAAVGTPAPSGPISSVPGNLLPPPEPARAYQPAPTYQPTPQPVPQQLPQQLPPQPVPQQQQLPPQPVPQQVPRPGPVPQPQPSGPVVPWDQWGTQAPAAAPQGYPQQSPPAYPGTPAPPPGYPPHPGYPPQPQQGYPPQPQPGYQPQPAPGAPQRAFAPAGGADDYEGTHLASARAEGLQRGPAEGWQVRLDDGRLIDVDGMVLIGRNPAARPDETVSQLISAGADSRMVSKTHLLVGTDHRGIFVTDRGSTNGTAIANANGQFEPCAPGDRVRVREGQVVSFGDRYLEIRRTH